MLKSGSITRGHGATTPYFEADEEPEPDPDPDPDPDPEGQPQLGLGFPHELQLLFNLLHPQLELGFPHELQMSLGFLHPHIGFGRLHLLQGRASEKPSFEPPTRTRRPSIYPIKRSRHMKPTTPAEARTIVTIPINTM